MVGEKLLDGAEGRVMRLGDSIMKSRTARKRMGQRFRLRATYDTHGTRSFAPLNQTRLGRELIGDSKIKGAGSPLIDVVQDGTRWCLPIPLRRRNSAVRGGSRSVRATRLLQMARAHPF